MQLDSGADSITSHMGKTPVEPGTAALRDEHDRLVARLSVRRSIDAVRRGSYAAFALLITGGLSVKLAYDRWGPHPPRAFKGPPVLFFAACAAALACLGVAVVSFATARRRMLLEDEEFARLRSLRDQLELDP